MTEEIKNEEQVAPSVEEKSDVLFEKKDEVVVEKKDETVLEKVETAQVPQEYDEDEAPGVADITPDDIATPKYRLLQKTSDEVEAGTGKAGTIVNSSTGQAFESLNIICLTMKKTRARFDPDNPKAAPLCRSSNLIDGSNCDCGCGNKCDKCVHTEWTAAANNKQSPPACGLCYNYPSLTVEAIEKKRAIPTIITFAKSSTEVAQKINTAVLSATQELNDGRIIRKPYWEYVWKIGVKLKPFAKGSAHIYTAQYLRDATPEEKQWCKNVYRNFIKGKSVVIENDGEV